MQKLHTQLSAVKTIGSHKFGVQFKKPIGIGVVGDLLVVLEQSGERIQVIRSDGLVVRFIGEGQLRDARCMVVGQDDNIYVCDAQKKKILAFHLDGVLCKEISGDFRMPVGIVHDGQNKRLLISDHKQNCIYQCNLEDNNPTVTVLVGDYGARSGQFKHPYGITLDSSNNFFVSDQDNRRIQKFRYDGTYIGCIQLTSYPTFVHYDRDLDLLFVSSSEISAKLLYVHKVEIFKNQDINCKQETLQDAHGMTTTRNNLFVCESANNCIRVYQISNI